MPGARPIGLLNEDKIRAALQGANPTKVRVKHGDDVVNVIALAKTRRKWSTFLEALARIPAWSSLDLLDKNGDTLQIVENDGEPGPLESLYEDSRDVKEVTRYERIAKVVLDAQLRGMREVFNMRSRETDTVMSAISGVVKELGLAIHTLNAAHSDQLAAVVEAAETRNQHQPKDIIEQITELAEAAPDLLPLIPMIKGLLPARAAKAAAGANGAAKANGANGVKAAG